jgi:hypothetical protein
MKSTFPTSVKEITYSDAVASGFDLVQAKAVGEPCRIEIADGQVYIYGYNDVLKDEFSIENREVCCTLLGARFTTPPLIIVIDCVSVSLQPKTVLGYRDRFAFAKAQVEMIDLPILRLVANYRIDKAKELWEKLDPVLSNGVVYRKSKAPFDAPFFVARKYPNIPGDLP